MDPGGGGGRRLVAVQVKVTRHSGKIYTLFGKCIGHNKVLLLQSCTIILLYSKLQVVSILMSDYITMQTVEMCQL